MSIIRRVFVSLPADQWLSKKQNNFKWGLVKQVEQWGYAVEIFNDPTGRTGLAAGLAWSAVEADRVMRRCVGALIIGLPRWQYKMGKKKTFLPTEYNHYEGAIAYTLGLPMLVVVQEDVLRRVVFDYNFHGHIGEFPASAGRKWLAKKKLTVPLLYWKKDLDERQDLFLGYSSGSTATAEKITKFLELEGVKVLDWKTDFDTASNILEEMQKAAARCSGGIFLFTNDDTLIDQGGNKKAVTRDNVIFEAGYFIQAKGKKRVLIVREKGVKILSDLGGDIYASLEDRDQIGTIEEDMRKLLRNL